MSKLLSTLALAGLSGLLAGCDVRGLPAEFRQIGYLAAYGCPDCYEVVETVYEPVDAFYYVEQPHVVEERYYDPWGYELYGAGTDYDGYYDDWGYGDGYYDEYDAYDDEPYRDDYSDGYYDDYDYEDDWWFGYYGWP